MGKTENHKKIRAEVKAYLQEKGLYASEISVSDVEPLVEELYLQKFEQEKKSAEACKAYEQLSYEKEKYQKVFAASNAGISIINSEGKITECNQAFAKMLGYNVTELLNTSIEKITYSGDFGNDFKSASKITIKKKQARFDKRYVHKNGFVIWCDVTTSILEQSDGAHYYVTVIKDISSQKYVEKKLRENEKQLELFFQQAHEGFFFMMLDKPIRWDDSVDKEATLEYVFKNQHITKINNNMLEQYRAKEEDFLNLTPEDLFDHDIAYGKKVWKEFFDNGRLSIDTEEQKFDGTPMIVTGEYICLYDDQNRITGHFGVQREVTNERKSESALKVSEEKFRTLIENSPLPIMMTDEKAIITDCNHALVDLLKIPKNDIVRQNIVSFHKRIFANGADTQNENNYAEKIKNLYRLHDKSPLSYNTNMTINGKEFILDQTIFSINTENGFRLASITRDITEQKMAERTIKQQKDSLEKHSAEKNVFFNIIAHDLRSPFNTLLGFSRLLLDKYDKYSDETKKQHIDKLYQTSKNTFQLTENLLTWARTQTGSTSFIPEETDIKSLISEVSALIKDTADKKEIRIISKVNHSELVYIDPNSIQTVLRNLLTNAIKFSYRKGQIIIETEKTKVSEKAFLRVCIMDEGIGMSSDLIENLFKLDKEITACGTEKEKGSGLGLLICKDFVERNGGQIEVQSSLGKGSKFCFTIPYIGDKQQSNILDADNNSYGLNDEFQILMNHHNQQVIIEKLDEQFHKTKHSMSSSSLHKFAATMENVGQNNKLYGFVDFGNALRVSTQSLDLDRVSQLLNNYEVLRNKI